MSIESPSANSGKRKLLSILCHSAIFFTSLVVSIGVPIAILLISDDPVVQGSAKESINFHITMWIYSVIVGILMWLLIGWLFVPILIAIEVIMPIFAILASLRRPHEVYRYPLIFRFV